jgi:phosphate starvation-inducible PhoH-like protein
VSKKKLNRREVSHPASVVPRPSFDPAALADRAGCQKEAAEKIERHDIVFLLGSAGTGKTWSAVNLARRRLLTNQVERIVVSRPAVECGGERLGFLPGEIGNKMLMWLLPFADVIRSDPAVGSHAEKELSSYECVPLAFIRGRTLSRCVAILDEAQNATMQQLRAFLTRIGHGGKLLVVGDPGQSDLPGGGPHLSLLASEMEKRGLAGVVRFPPSAVCRHPLIQGIETLFNEQAKR